MENKNTMKVLIDYCNELKDLLQASEKKFLRAEESNGRAIKRLTEFSDSILHELNDSSIKRVDDALTLFTDNGWREIRSISIYFIRVSRRNFMTSKEYLENRKYGFSNRKKCDCCSKKWENLEGDVNVVAVNTGEKVICDSCLEHLENNK